MIALSTGILSTEATSHHCLQRSMISEEKELIFDSPNGFDTALSDGFFLIKIPEYIDLMAGDKFAKNFYQKKVDIDSEDNIYRGYDIYTPDKFNLPHEGYYLREIDQVEQFFLEQRYWKEVYPPSLVTLAMQLNELAIDILKNVLKHLSIPEQYWAKATGEAVNNKGDSHLTFNHFRKNMNCNRGLNTHKDSGWVTILRSIEPGLEAFINNKWLKINPEKGFFIVNFGCAMEILTAKLDKPVSAIIHRVTKQYTSTPLNLDACDRFSYALFTDNSLDESVSLGLYSYDRKNGLKFEANFREFLKDILTATYNEDTVGLY